MRCYICDTNLERTSIDPLTGKIKHCSACDEVIQENLMSLERRGTTEPEEENSGELPLLENDWDDMILTPEDYAMIAEGETYYE